MKISRQIPPEVLSLEDKVFGNLNFIQVIVCFCGGCVCFLLLAPTPYHGIGLMRILILSCVLGLSSTVLVRIHSKLVYQWLIIIVKYSLSPRIYLHPNSEFLTTKEPKSSKPKLRLKQRLKIWL